ncbi:HAD family hydrolase [Aeromicrobium sp. 179-A 4D2 NHS]|uniref:HAD family hydrolase n=1 Tax=Aeromicrobium sp. 179-A 4D2 NHS TaxID=3142375 RepID=UPI0039A2A356
MTTWFEDRPVPQIRAVLCDADGTLFPSEEPAYEASAIVTNRFLDHLGVDLAYEPAELQRLTNGRNFRSSAALLADLHERRLDADDLEHWVAVERDVVTAHLRTVLRPDCEVRGPLAELARRLPLAVVTSSAGPRLAACLEVTGLTGLFESATLFSAESSLPRPVSKPDPAVYTFACERLGVSPAEAVAVEDSVNGALSAVAAGCRTIGTVQFVPPEQRADRIAALREAGADVVVDSWWEIVRLLNDLVPIGAAAPVTGADA